MSKKILPDPIIYYTAGIIDGEGTITLTRSSAKSLYRFPVVSCTSTTPKILDFLAENFGGTISKQKTYKEHHKEAWSWKITNLRAVEFCELFHPYLIEPDKRRRAKHIADGYRTVTRRNGKYNEVETQEKLEFESTFF